MNIKKISANIQRKLSRLSEIDGFMGTAVFSPEGLLLAKCEPSDLDLKLIGSLANNVLTNVHKASFDMGFGRCHSTYIHTEKALVLLRCLNEGKNPLHAEPGKCHIHLVLLVDNPDSLGIAKLKINQVIDSLAEHFRLPERTEPIITEDVKRKDRKKREKQEIEEAAHSLDNEKIDKIFDELLV